MFWQTLLNIESNSGRTTRIRQSLSIESILTESCSHTFHIPFTPFENIHPL